MSETSEATPGAEPAGSSDKVARAQAFCGMLLEKLGARVDVEVKESADAIAVSLKPREGNALDLTSALVEALQYLVNRVVNPRAEGRKWVNLDVGGFREDSDPVVKAMAERVAATARKIGKVIAVAPISARDRRQIHLALVDTEGVSTRSEGEGIFRQLLVIPETAGAAGPGPGRKEG